MGICFLMCIWWFVMLLFVLGYFVTLTVALLIYSRGLLLHDAFDVIIVRLLCLIYCICLWFLVCFNLWMFAFSCSLVVCLILYYVICFDFLYCFEFVFGYFLFCDCLIWYAWLWFDFIWRLLALISFYLLIDWIVSRLFYLVFIGFWSFWFVVLCCGVWWCLVLSSFWIGLGCFLRFVNCFVGDLIC